MALDPREFIRLHAGMPEHPKVDPLSDAAFRCLIEAWCLCRRTRNDGRIPIATWRKKWKARARNEVVAAGLVLLEKDAAVMHDWLEHQPSVEALDAKRQARSDAGRKGGMRSGESRRAASKPATELEANASGFASPELERTLKQTTNGIEPELEIEKESSYVGGVSYGSNARENPPPKRHPGHPELLDGCEECAQTATTREAWLQARLADAPPPHCPNHPGGTVNACGPCGDARKAHKAWQQAQTRAKARAHSADAREAADLRAAAIASCPLGCAATGGYLGTSLCSHDPKQAERAQRGMAEVRAAMAAKRGAKSPTPETVSPASEPAGAPQPTSEINTRTERAHA